jgi:diphthamide biosynthesis methyltransferase
MIYSITIYQQSKFETWIKKIKENSSITFHTIVTLRKNYNGNDKN